MRPYAKVFALAVLAHGAAAATEPLFPALIKPLLDGGFAPSGQRSWPPAASPPRSSASSWCAASSLSASSYCLAWVAQPVVLDLRAAMFARLVRLPAKYFDDNSSGTLLSKVAYDVTGVTDAATTVLTVLIKDSIVIVLLLGWLLYLNWKLTLIALVVGPPIAFTVRLISSRLRRMAREALSSQGDLVHVLQETIDCHKVVKVFGGQDYETQRFRSAAQALRGFNMRSRCPGAHHADHAHARRVRARRHHLHRAAGIARHAHDGRAISPRS